MIIECSICKRSMYPNQVQLVKTKETVIGLCPDCAEKSELETYNEIERRWRLPA
jgi:hypothetical protein